MKTTIESQTTDSPRSPKAATRLYRFDQYPTIHKISNDYSRHRLLIGPVGSGKTSWCCNEMVKIATLIQRPAADGVRYSRWLVARNTYGQLADTTIPSFMYWYPAHLCGGVWSAEHNKYTIKAAGIHMEILFRSLDRPDNIQKLLSLELTGAWLNEAREIPRAIFDMVDGRIGRYPAKSQGGATWSGIIMDTNPPDDDSWLARYFEHGDLPSTASVYRQSSGLSPEAENVQNLPKDYYQTLAIGKTKDYINVYIHGLNGFVKEGRGVYETSFNPELHIAKNPLAPINGIDYLIGFDFGLTPAAIVCQVTPTGHVNVLEEMTLDGTGGIARLLDERVLPALATKYKGNVLCIGDPSGQNRSQDYETTCFSVFKEKKLKIEAAPTNLIEPRIRAVEDILTRLTAGRATLQVSPQCRRLVKGFMGGYCYRQINSGGGEKYSNAPDKNEYSHIHDAFQYVALVLGRYNDKNKKQYAEQPYDGGKGGY